MAEGDTLVRLARRLGPVLTGQEIVAASAPNPRSGLRPHAPRLKGRRVESIETRGKHLLIHLDEGLSLHSHLGMNGGWRVDEGRGFGKPDRTSWLLIEMAPDPTRLASDPTRLASDPTRPARVAQFGGTTLRLVRTVELDRDPRLARLGPDILAPDFDLEAASSRLRSSPDEIGVALLDQKLVCGIGNIFKSEACFEAAIDPWRPAESLGRDSASLGSEPASLGRDSASLGNGFAALESKSGGGLDEAVALLETARRQMLAAVETGKRPGRIYKKTGRPCFRCRRARIRSRAQGDDGRTTYWCPNCQS